METTAIKREINQLVDLLPEELLGDVLIYLQQLDKTPPEKVKLAIHFRQILREDSELLRKLAQ